MCPQVIAHRGASYYAPENTAAAITLASEQGAKWIEVDLHLTRDNGIFIIHNSTVNKCTNGKGRVRELDSSELEKLDAGSWYSKQYANQRLLSLPELIQLGTQLDLNFNLELKAEPGLENLTAQISADIVKQYWPKNKALPLFSSFSTIAVEAIKQALVAAPRALLVDVWNDDLKNTAIELECVSINANRKLINDATLASMHDTGCKVLVYTVNDLDLACQLISMGVDGIFTDKPKDVIIQLQQQQLYQA
jgi:glycerophosphoryl diester phosphodiesterase